MNLVVDIGNTGIKFAIYTGNDKTAFLRMDTEDEEVFLEFIKKYDIKKAIISTVRDIPIFLENSLYLNIPYIHIMSGKTRIPFPVDYETPETLGSDRIAAIAGAFKTFPGKDCLVIDAGSAITYDFLIDGRYNGGNISPGIEMRFRALNIFTGRLPLIQRKSAFSFPAINTADAITAGVISGVIFEINEYIRTFEQKHKGSAIIITGGDSDYLKERVMGKLEYMPDLVIEGLNFILEYNA
ncbi:MAG: type III pantothenate kinase [Bacteroidales bacterium]